MRLPGHAAAARRSRAPPRAWRPTRCRPGCPRAAAHLARHGEGGLVADRQHLVDQVAVEDFRHEAGADALDLVRPGRAARKNGAVLRLDGDDPQSRRRGFSTWAQPVMVPPVPTPATRTSSRPPVSRQISSAVVRRWIAGLAGFSNCCRMMAPGISRDQPLGRIDGAAHALRRRRQLEFGAQQRSILRRSIDMLSGMVRISR